MSNCEITKPTLLTVTPAPAQPMKRNCWDTGREPRFRERLQEQFNLRKEFEQKNTDLLRQRQAGEIDETFYQQGLALNKRYLEERLRDRGGILRSF